MQTVFRQVALAAPTRVNILVVGESGTEIPLYAPLASDA